MVNNRVQTEQDSPWKEFLERFFEPFILYFFPNVHAEIDWNKKYTFLDKELQRVVRDSAINSRFADKLVKVYRKNGQEQWVLIHIEVQGSQQTEFEKRMFTYHYRLFDRYQKPVAGFAVLTDGNDNWRPSIYSSEIWNTRLTFEFNLVKILDFEKTAEAAGPLPKNPIEILIRGHQIARLTKPESPQRLDGKLALIKHLYRSGLKKEAILELFRILDWLISLSTDLAKEFKIDFERFEREEIAVPYVTSIERIYQEEYREKYQKDREKYQKDREKLQKDREKDRKQVREQIHNERQALAKKLLAAGMSPKQVVDLIELSLDEVNRLATPRSLAEEPPPTYDPAGTSATTATRKPRAVKRTKRAA